MQSNARIHIEDEESMASMNQSINNGMGSKNDNFK